MSWQNERVLSSEDYGVSLISVEGLNFDCFLPLFGERGSKIPVAVITDADPLGETSEGEYPAPLYPGLADEVVVSANTAKMKALEDSFVKVFHGVKTFEYDLALRGANHAAMIATLKDLHPQIGAAVEATVSVACGETEKAKALYCGMFERKQGSIQKGRYGQALAETLLQAGISFEIPQYLLNAVTHVCQTAIK